MATLKNAKLLYEQKLVEVQQLLNSTPSPLTKTHIIQLKKESHDLSGTAGLFGDDKIEEASRSINTYIRDTEILEILANEHKILDLTAKLKVELSHSSSSNLDDIFSDSDFPDIDETPSTSILSVDDDPVVLEVIQQYFTQKGTKVFTATSVKDAFELLKTTPIELIISDVEMPKFTGIQFLKKLREQTKYKQIPIIFLSISRTEANLLECIKLGATEFVTKPFDVKKLHEKVMGLLNYKTRSILVVDDDPIIETILTETLLAKGYSVNVISDGNQVVDAAKFLHPNLILLDRMLPGKEGLTILVDLKEEKETQDIPVIIVSAKTQETEVVDALKKGAADCVGKPLKLNELMIRIDKLLN